MGRVTYEFFRTNWGSATGDPYIDRINAMPKHVASRSLTETTWNATLVGSDIVGEMGHALLVARRCAGATFDVFGDTLLERLELCVQLFWRHLCLRLSD